MLVFSLKPYHLSLTALQDYQNLDYNSTYIDKKQLARI